MSKYTSKCHIRSQLKRLREGGTWNQQFITRDAVVQAPPSSASKCSVCFVVIYASSIMTRNTLVVGAELCCVGLQIVVGKRLLNK